jgi:hypothetical protein
LLVVGDINELNNGVGTVDKGVEGCARGTVDRRDKSDGGNDATGVGATGVGATGVGATGADATGADATGVGATGVGATGVGATGADATGVGATGADATGVGATGVGATGVGATGADAIGATTIDLNAIFRYPPTFASLIGNPATICPFPSTSEYSVADILPFNITWTVFGEAAFVIFVIPIGQHLQLLFVSF